MIKSCQEGVKFKSDERVLGDSDFVDTVLKAADEKLDRKYRLQSAGYGFEGVAFLFAQNDINPEERFSMLKLTIGSGLLRGFAVGLTLLATPGSSAVIAGRKPNKPRKRRKSPWSSSSLNGSS